MKKQILVTIQGKRDEEAPVRETLTGTYVFKNKKHYCLCGDDRLIFSSDTASIRRKGLTLSFAPGAAVSQLYPTPYGAIPLVFRTLSCVSAEADDCITLRITYETLQDDALLGTHEMEITVVPDPNRR